MYGWMTSGGVRSWWGWSSADSVGVRLSPICQILPCSDSTSCIQVAQASNASCMRLAVSMVSGKDCAVGPARLAACTSYGFRLIVCQFCGNGRWPLNSLSFCAAEPEMRVSGRRKHAEQRSTGSLVRQSGRPTGATTAVAQVAS